MKFLRIFFYISFLFSTTAFAQIDQPLRVEIQLENDRDDYTVVPVGEYGVVMYTLTSDKVEERNKAKWMFTGYTTEFSEKWKSGYIINDAYDVRDYYYSDGFLYLLFGRYNREEIVMAILNVKTGEIASASGLLPAKFGVKNFKVNNGEVYINGMVRREPSLVYFELGTGKFKKIDLKFQAEASFESIDVDSINNEVNIVYSINKRREQYINIKSFRNGQLLNDLIINPEGDDNLLTGKITTISANEKIIIGTYSSRGSSGTNGMYFARLINDSEFIIKYYHFTGFNSFFSFLSERDKERIERKKERSEKKGKELNMNYQLLVHDLIKKDGQYLMIAEAYYATYRTEPYTYTTIINGIPVIQTRYVTVFDGWLYTHAVVSAFDMEGNMLWDNSIEMGDVKSFNLVPRVSINVKGEDIVLAYGTYEEIKTKVIRGDKVLDGKEDTPIKTGFENDVVKRAVLSSVYHWYDKYFLVYGYQKIKNDKEEQVKRKRTVFYFNKIAYKD